MLKSYKELGMFTLNINTTLQIRKLHKNPHKSVFTNTGPQESSRNSSFD